MWGFLGFVAVVGAGIGINSVIGGGEIPQIAGNDNNEENIV